jgi:hypothetical protein
MKDFIPKESCPVASGDCFYEARCLRACGKTANQTGWKCPVCWKGNAPFAATCGNPICGIDLSKGATA